MFYLGFLPQTTVGTNPTFNDTGTAVPNVYFGTPLQNSTQGITGSTLVTYHDTLFIGGIPSEPSRVYYSAGVDLFDNFQIVNGGGSILVNPEDGDKVTALVVYKDKVMIFKNRSSYLFAFAGTAFPTLAVVNPEIGCVAGNTAKVVLNDIYCLGVGGSGVFTLGYQSGYFGVGQADMLRSNEVSTKIHPDLATINTSYMQNAYAIHTAQHYNYILAIPVGGSTTNNSVYVFDTRYNAWMKWDDMNIQCMTVLVDSTNTENVLYGDALEGRVDKFYSGSNDKGSAFTFRMRTKDFNAKAFHLIKTFIWPTFHFRNNLREYDRNNYYGWSYQSIDSYHILDSLLLRMGI